MLLPNETVGGSGAGAFFGDAFAADPMLPVLVFGFLLAAGGAGATLNIVGAVGLRFSRLPFACFCIKVSGCIFMRCFFLTGAVG